MDKVVAICCRISKDRSGRTEGVKLQERQGREYAAEHWPGVPVEVFADGDNSAMNGGPRPEHERFKEWLAAGRIAHVWSVEQSRLERDEVQWFGLAAELDDAGIHEVHTRRDGIVRVRDEVAGIKAVLNASEVRKMKKRLLDTLADKAAAGLPAPGTHTCYRRTKTDDGIKTLEPIPERASAFAWAADALLSGWSLGNVTVELRARGILGSRGGQIRENAVRSALLSPVIAGYRVHQGQVVGKGNWPAVLDETTWRALVARLTSDRVVQSSDGRALPVPGTHRNRPGRKYLLTGGGLTVCGVCGHEMVGALKQRRGRPERPWMLCHPVKGGKACVAVAMDRVVETVLEQLWAELDRPEFLEAVAVDEHAGRRDEIVKQMGDLEQQRTELAALWATPGLLTTAEWAAARQELSRQERALNTELAEIPAPRVNVDITEARTAWDYMTLDEQRQFVRLFIDRVTIKRATPKASRFDPKRVEIEWRTA